VQVSGATIATPNCREAHHAAGLGERSNVANPARDRTLRKVGEVLLKKWKLAHLVITLGSQGMYLVSKGREPQVIPTKAREVFDVSGAGDTVIAACLLAIASGATYGEAAMIGNYAAGVVVGKLGTATCSPAELLACIAEDERLSA
jgi:D-glycero-beta-D-manno-heptose-7-phosphate kinase